ncbi:MAG TPA: hypothetical protein VND40_05860 [Nitrososphaerales archaeon]|nr:hypothetical protein [Nitrososphaerales archaeon]
MTTSLMDWLLDDGQPSVVYRVLMDVQGRKDRDDQVRQALAAVPQRGWAAELLADQHDGGFWESKGRPLHAKVPSDHLDSIERGY